MKLLIYIILFSNTLLSISLAQEAKSVKYLYKVSKDSIQGLEIFAYANSKGDIVVPFGKYPYLFTDTIKTIGFVSKAKNGFWAINRKGKELFKIVPFDNGPDNLCDGLYRILDKHDNIGFANEKGKIIIKPKFSFVDPFHKGVARFCLGCPKRMFMQSIENLIKMPKHNGKFGMIDLKGKIIIPAIYDSIRISDNNKIMATKEGKEYFFDFKGKQ